MIAIWNKWVSEAAKKVQPSERGEIEITSLHNYYLEKGELEVGIVEGEWLDAGTFDSLLEAGNIVKKKKLYEKFDPIIDAAIAEFSAVTSFWSMTPSPLMSLCGLAMPFFMASMML